MIRLPAWLQPRLVAVAAAAIALIAIVVAVAWPEPTPLEQAVTVAHDDTRFATADASGHAFLRVGILLKQQGEDCAGGRTPVPTKCNRYFTGAAVMQVFAVNALRCRLPVIYEAREETQAYLDALVDGHDPLIPRPPSCKD